MGLRNRWLFNLSGGMPCRHIRTDAGPYLERYYVGRVLGVTFYLHRFLSGDRERHLHNHPWGWARALVLAGGYDEEVVHDLATAAPDGCVTRPRRIRLWNRVNGNHFHRIANAAPGTWTLFFHGPRSVVHVPDGHGPRLKGWGFLNVYPGLVAFEPFRSGDPQWFLSAPKGRNAGRVPL